MALNRFVTSINPDDNTASILGSTGLAVCELTSKPPKEEDYGTYEEWVIAYNKHYEDVVTGYEIKRNMIVNNGGITFSDGTVQTTAAINGSSSLTPVNNNTITGSGDINNLVSNKTFSTSTNDLGLSITSVLPGPNGRKNGLPEQCNSMIFLKLFANLTPLGLDSSVPCYIPCYFQNNKLGDTPFLIEGKIDDGDWVTSQALLDLYEGNWGLSQVDNNPRKDPELYPNSRTFTIKVSPPPTDPNTVIELNYDSPGQGGIFISRLSYYDYQSKNILNSSNNWQQTWTFTIENNNEKDPDALGQINLTSQSSISEYSGLTYTISFQLSDNEDVLIIRDPWESSYIKINSHDETPAPNIYSGMNEVNSNSFDLIVEYVDYSETSTDKISPHLYENNLTLKDRALLDAWRTNAPLSTYNQTASGIDLKTSRVVMNNIYINTDGKFANSTGVLGSGDGLFGLAIKIKPDANNTNDNDDSNNKAYPIIFMIRTNDATTLHNTGEGNPNSNPLYTFSGDPNNSSYKSTTMSHPGLELMTWFLFGDLRPSSELSGGDNPDDPPVDDPPVDDTNNPPGDTPGDDTIEP